MFTTVLDTAIIGAGAAGLTVGKHLADRGVRFELFDGHARVGDSWRERYRSLRLFTPRRFASLPGLRPDIGRFDYPTGEQMGDYLEHYVQQNSGGALNALGFTEDLCSFTAVRLFAA